MAGDRLRLRLDGRIELVHKVSPGGRVLCDVFRQYSLARVLELEASGLLYRVPDCDGVRK